MTEPDPGFLDYRVRWRSGEARPGKHAARHGGTGGDVRGYRPFWQLPDARRIDLRRSLLDPSGAVVVRQTEHRASLTVVLAADVSRSMRPAAERSGLDDMAVLAQAAARSALRAGDSFAFLPFDRTVRDAASCPPSRAPAAAGQVAGWLRRFEPTGTGAEGIGQLAARLPGRRCLVLLVSDFLMPLDLLDAALSSLARHDVAPVVLRQDSARGLPRAGLLRLQDAETGRARLVLMQPALRRRWLEAEVARRGALDGAFRRHGRAGFYVGATLDVDALSRHLSEKAVLF